LLQEPQKLKSEPLDRWKELGPISRIDIMMHAADENPIIYESPFGLSEK